MLQGAWPNRINLPLCWYGGFTYLKNGWISDNDGANVLDEELIEEAYGVPAWILRLEERTSVGI